MSEDLKILSSTVRELELINYPDSYRIAKEIVAHFKGSEEKIKEAITRLKQNEPWDYIRGYTLFRNLKISVNQSVLIPRIETEQIIDIAKEALQNAQIKTIIDVGTGSGAIIKAMQEEVSGQYNYIAVEKSPEALKIAQKNLAGTDIKLVKSDLLENIQIDNETLIIANLPYIPTKQYEKLDRSVKEYEPKEALDGGENGIDIIDRLLSQCSERKSISKIILEIDPETIDFIDQAIEKHLPVFKWKTILDYRNQTRFVLIEKD